VTADGSCLKRGNEVDLDDLPEESVVVRDVCAAET